MYALFSHALKIPDLLLVPPEEHLGEALEWVVDVLGLKGAHLEELEADALREGQTVLGAHRDTVLQVDLVGYHHAHQGAALVLLLYAL